MDTVSREKRSEIMSAIHSRDTLPEVVVRKMLWANGYRFRVCDKRIVGHPDIVIPKCRALIEGGRYSDVEGETLGRTVFSASLRESNPPIKERSEEQ